MADNIITVDALERNSGILDDDLFYTLNRNKTEHDDMDAKTTAEQVKNYVRPPNADAVTDGLVTASEQRIGGKKIFTGGIQVGEADGANCDLTVEKNAEVKGDVAVGGNLTLTGDLVVDGEVRRVETQSLEVAENEIVTRKDATTGLGIDDDAGNKYTGLRARKYDGTNDGRLVFDKDGVARVGDVGSEQPLATRVETPANGTLAIWNSTLNRYEPITQGEAGDLLESQGQGERPQFTTLPKVSIKKVTQTQQSDASSGENVWECELTNGVKSNFIVKNGGRGSKIFYGDDISIGSGGLYQPPNMDASDLVDGDMYFVTSNFYIWKVENGAWSVVGCVKGAAGTDGRSIVLGSVSNTSASFNFNYLLDLETGNMYKSVGKSSGGGSVWFEWELQGCVKGPKGDTITQIEVTTDNIPLETPYADALIENTSIENEKKIKIDLHGLKGQDGITTNLSGFVTLQVDGNGDLWATTATGAVGCPFEYEALNGNLYVELGD